MKKNGAGSSEIRIALLPGERVVYKARHGPLAFLKFMPAPVAIATNKRFMVLGGLIKQYNISISYDGIAAVGSVHKLLWSDFVFHLHSSDKKRVERNALTYLKKAHALALFSIISNQIAYSKGEPPLSSYDPSAYPYHLPLITGPALTKFARREDVSTVQTIKKKVQRIAAKVPSKKQITEARKTIFNYNLANIAIDVKNEVHHKLKIPTYTANELAHESASPLHKSSNAMAQTIGNVVEKRKLDPDRDLHIFRVRKMRSNSSPPVFSESV